MSKPYYARRSHRKAMDNKQLSRKEQHQKVMSDDNNFIVIWILIVLLITALGVGLVNYSQRTAWEREMDQIMQEGPNHASTKE